MKSKVNKEQALKAVLFITVATTLSWPGGFHPQSIDLASEVVTVDNATAQPSDDAKPLSMSPETMMLAVGKVKMPQKPKPLGKNINPLTKKPLLHTTGKLTVCAVPLTLTMDEKTDGHTVRTEVVVHEVSPVGAGIEILVPQPGSFSDNGITADSINKAKFPILKKKIEDESRAKLSEAGRCDGGTPAETAPAPEEEVDPSQSPAPRSERDDAAAIANCMINPRTHRAYRSSEVLQCNIKKLETLGQMDDGDGRNSSRVARELTRLVKNGIYPNLKNQLMSANPDDQSRAQDMIDDIITRIEDLGSSFNISTAQTTPLTNSLRGLKAGADAFQRANDMKQDVTQLRKDFQDARANGQNGQQGQIPSYLYRQLQDLQTRLQTEIAQGPIQELNQYSQYMQVRDVKLFTGPYEQLQKDIQAMSGQGGQGQMGPNGQQMGPNGMPMGGQVGPNGMPIGGQVGPNGMPIGGVQYGPNGQIIAGQPGAVGYGPNGMPIGGGIQYGPNGQIISTGAPQVLPAGQVGYGIQNPALAAQQAQALQYQQQLAYQNYLAQMSYSNGGIMSPNLLGAQSSLLMGRQGSPWTNPQGLIMGGAFQNGGVAASILPAQTISSPLIAGAGVGQIGTVGSPFRNGSAFGGTTAPIFPGGSGVISAPPPPPISAGLYGSGFSGSGYYNRTLPVMPPSRIAPSVLPMTSTSYGLASTTTPFRR